MKKPSPAVQKIIVGAVVAAAFGGMFAGSVVIICTSAEVPKMLALAMFLFGSVGTLLGIGLIVRGLIDRRKTQAYPGGYFQNFQALTQNPAEDVNRKEVEYDDEAGFKELEEHTENFLENLTYPRGFVEFLAQYSGVDNTIERLKRCFTDDRHGGEALELADVYPPDKIKELNKDILLYNDDFMTQFRDILIFADDGSGHCHFILDYGRGKPAVKYLDDETGIVTLLADDFEEFAQKLVFNPDDD